MCFQNGETNMVIDNIHSIIAAAGVKFNTQQLEHLVILIQQSWRVENNKMREKLLKLIGKIGREAKIDKITTRVCEALLESDQYESGLFGNIRKDLYKTASCKCLSQGSDRVGYLRKSGEFCFLFSRPGKCWKFSKCRHFSIRG